MDADDLSFEYSGVMSLSARTQKQVQWVGNRGNGVLDD